MLSDIENKAIDGYTEEQYAALKTLIIDTLNYGAAAQIYKNYKTDSLVNAGVNGGSEFTELGTEAGASGSASSSTDAKITAGGIRFDNVNSIYFKLLIADGADVKVSVSAIDGVAMDYTLSDMVALGDNEYKLYTRAIKPSNFDERYTVTLYVNGEAVQTIEYSVAAYVQYIQNETKDGELSAMAKLARAVYVYGSSVKAYADKIN